MGDQFTLLVGSRHGREVSIPEFGLVAFAGPNAPARFELLPQAPGRFGILFTASGKPAGQIEVLARHSKKGGKKKPQGKEAKSRAPAGSNRT